MRRVVDLSYSLGLAANENGGIVNVHVDTPAFRAGLAPATRIVAVNGRQFTMGVLRRAVADAERSPAPIALIVRDGEYYKTYNVDYHEGEKYPHLLRSEAPDYLSDILKPLLKP